MRNAAEARATVLDFFGASKEDYTVVFTPNATGALKLVGEAFPFKAGGSYVLGADSHNSVRRPNNSEYEESSWSAQVNGIRQFAIEKGADLVYIPTTTVGGMEINVAKVSDFFLLPPPKLIYPTPGLAVAAQTKI
jgi:molybdenum cofactor sulfurtransferase